ncbi:MAG: DUF4111 domain-containing protein [Pseudomonadales bacterium]|nr:DUF4111 domain-containing protein [Pseudomonadales bacterium]
MRVTKYSDINKILSLLKEGLGEILGKNLIGLYLTGSLTYGDFDRGSSDIDFFSVLDEELSPKQLEKVKKLHTDIGERFPEWHKRIEGSYVTQKMLDSTKPPKRHRPYINAGKMWSFPFGNEWLLNLHILYESGVALVGINPKQLISPVDIISLRKASQENLIQEWKPKLTNPAPFQSADYDRNHLQAYAILTMCRILYTANNKDVVSKKVAANWAVKMYGEQWSALIKKAQSWHHGEKLFLENGIKKFIQFTIDEVG